MKKILQYIFSVKNQDSHKILTILGIKFKFRNTKIENNKEFFLSNKQIEDISWAIRDKFFGIVNGVMFSPCETLIAEAHQDSVSFIKENMNMDKIMLKNDRISNLKYSLSLAKKPGLILEFGVFSGETINIIANYFNDNKIYGFDSFEGLPEDWNGWALEKTFFKRNNMPLVQENVDLIKGWFNETLPTFLNSHDTNISFLHIDCDIYSSAKYVLTTLQNKIIPGTVIVFDEFFNFPNWKNHEYKAFMEFINLTNYKFEYVSIGRDQVTVIITE